MRLASFTRELRLWLSVFALVHLSVWPSSGSPEPGQGFRILHKTTEDDLPSNTIISLLQSHDGYLWVGTKHGLARFDGVKFKVFIDELRIDGSDDLRCQQLVEDADGQLWVRLPGGLVKYQQGQFAKFPFRAGSLNPPALVMVGARGGGLWVGTQGEGLKLFRNGQYQRTVRMTDGLAKDSIGLLREDNQGRVWIGYGNDSWQRFDPESGEVKFVADIVGGSLGEVRDVQPCPDGAVWLATDTRLLVWRSGKLQSFSNQQLWNRFKPPDIEVAPNEAWIRAAFLPKLVHFHDGQFDVLGIPDGLADSDFRALLLDREGNLWVGTGSAGVQRFTPGNLTSLFTLNAKAERQQIDSACAGRGGTVWLGAWESLLRSQHGSVICYTNPHPAFNQEDLLARPVLEDSAGHVWFGSRDQGLFTLAGGQVVRVPNADDGRGSWKVTALYEDRSGTLWVGSDCGLSRRCEDRFIRFTTRDGLCDNEIRGMLESGDGGLWVGTKTGLQKLRNGRFEQTLTTAAGLLAAQARPLLVEPDGTLWVGTPGGLNRIRAGSVRAVTPRQGLPDSELFCLLDDGTGSYWTSSVRGILRVRKEELHAAADGRLDRLSCVSYGEADGALSSECTGDYQPNACRTSDGRLWFPTTHGVVVLDPARLLRNTVAPPVVIEEVLADDQLIVADGAVTPAGARMNLRPSAIALPAGYSRIEIRYTANTFVAPEKVTFRCRLDGVDHQWREVGRSRTATYTTLKPGTYSFCVTGSNEQGVWSAGPATLAFSIAPHFYTTWSFYAGTSLSVALLAYAFHSARIRALRQIQSLERQRALAEERGRIARDLHDDLGASLTGIALQLETAQKRGQARGAELGTLADEARSLTHEIRELAWTTNPRCDNLASVVAFITESAERFCRAAGLALRLELPPVDQVCAIPARQRHHLLAVLKESLANIAKHAAARQVTISLRGEKGELELVIRDDGKGFNSALAPAGSGLENMRERIRQMGGVLRIETRPGTGTAIVVTLPINHDKT